MTKQFLIRQKKFLLFYLEVDLRFIFEDNLALASLAQWIEHWPGDGGYQV